VIIFVCARDGNFRVCI